eukprot:SAG31_NODE_5301_length_2621_cov_10.452022_4_plen_148_part_00
MTAERPAPRTSLPATWDPVQRKPSLRAWPNTRREGKGREGKGREGKGREGRGKGEGREGEATHRNDGRTARHDGWKRGIARWKVAGDDRVSYMVDTSSISALHLAIKVPYFSHSGHKNEKVTNYLPPRLSRPSQTLPAALGESPQIA